MAVRILQEASDANVDQGFVLHLMGKDVSVRTVFTPPPLNITYCSRFTTSRAFTRKPFGAPKQ